MGKALSLLVLSGTKIEGHSADQVYQSNTDFVKVFLKRYEAAYMWFYMQKVNRELEGKEDLPKWKLNQRKWKSFNRPIKQGILHLLSKQTRKKWKKVYCVIQSDYSLEVYKTKQEFENAENMLFSNKFSGHKIISDVDTFLHKKLEISCSEFGYVNQDLAALSRKVTMIGRSGKRPTQHVFSATHTWRKSTTYFAAETAIEKENWVRALKDCIRHLEGVHDCDEVSADAFMFAIEQSIRLQEFEVDKSLFSGTQEEILADMMIEIQSQDCKVVLLPHITGGLVTKYETWNFIIFATFKWMQKIIRLEYRTQHLEAETRCKEHRENIVTRIPQIFDAYRVCAKAIESALSDCFDPVLKLDILPEVPRTIATMYDSLMSPIRASRELFIYLVEGVLKKISITSPNFANNIDGYFLSTLDYAPRNAEFMHPSKDVNMIALSQLQQVFPGSNLAPYVLSIYTHQQRLLDSAVCTFESLCGEAVAKGNGKLSESLIFRIQATVLKRLDSDILNAQKHLFHAVVQSATMEQTRGAVEHACKGKMSDFEYQIDPEVADYLPINNVFSSVLVARFNELFEPVLNTSLKQLNMLCAVQTSSRCSSVSSCITDAFEPRNSPKPVRRNSCGEICHEMPIFGDGMDGETGEIFSPEDNKETKRSRGVGSGKDSGENHSESPDSGILMSSSLNGKFDFETANSDLDCLEPENPTRPTAPDDGFRTPENATESNEHMKQIDSGEICENAAKCNSSLAEPDSEHVCVVGSSQSDNAHGKRRNSCGEIIELSMDQQLG